MVHQFELVLNRTEPFRTGSKWFSSVRFRFRQNPNGSVHGSGKMVPEPNRTELWQHYTDISKAISSYQKAVHLTPQGHADMPSLLNNLGNSLCTRFKCTGDLTDISEAISSHQKAVHLTPQGHADMSAWLGNLGSSFQSRFEF